MNTRAQASDLVAIQLRHRDIAAPLRSRAMAQIVGKLLFSRGQSKNTRVGLGDLKLLVSEATGLSRIPEDDIASAAEYLRSIGWLRRKELSLSPTATKEIRKNFETTRQSINLIIKKYFPTKIQRETRRNWFLGVSSEYFGAYGTHAVSTMLNINQPPGVVNRDLLHDIIEASSKAHGIERYSEALRRGYTGFLRGEDSESQGLIWNFWQSTFSARLIQAKVGAEPVTTNLLSKSMVFLDTNILIAASLSEDTDSKKVRLLLRAVKELGCTLMALPATVSEYQSRVTRARVKTLRVQERMPAGIVANTSDDFVQEALVRGCATGEDFQRFFDSLMNPVECLQDDATILVCSDPALLEVAEAASADPDLAAQVSNVWSRYRSDPKRSRAVSHDAQITGVVEHCFENGRRAWALTLDRTLTDLSFERSGNSLPPTWIHFSSAVEILAVDSGGPSLRAEDYGVLLSTLISGGLEPVSDTYTINDLALLIDIEARCAELPVDTINDIAHKIAAARMTGRGTDDRELRLEINRIFQGERLRITGDRDAAIVELNAARMQLQLERERREMYESHLAGVLVSKIRKRATLRFFCEFAGSVLYAGGLAWLGVWLVLSESNVRIAFGGACLGIAITGPALIWTRFRTWRRTVASADKAAQQGVKEVRKGG